MAEFCERYANSFERWWDDLGEVKLDRETAARLVAGVEAESKNRTPSELSETRDEMIVALLKAGAPLRGAPLDRCE